MTIQCFTVNPFQTNCYVCHDQNEAVLIDPGSSTIRERLRVLDYIEQNNLTIRHLLLTHGHIDHIIDCSFFADQFRGAFQIHPADVPLLLRAQDQGRMFGIALDSPPVPGALLNEGETLSFGDATWKILHTPGHSPGSICFHDEENAFVISGDVLFNGSIGRTDLWQGSLPQLLESIHQKLMSLSDETQVFPGHGPDTRIGHERRTNPFLT